MPYLLSPATVHLGLLDGSAGVAISSDAFISVSDEINVMHRLSTRAGESAVKALDLNTEFPGFPLEAKLDKDGKSKPGKFREADLEGAARVGDVVYWLGSHSCDAHAMECRERQVLFATELTGIGGETKPVPTGKVYQGLLGDMIGEALLKDYGLEAASKARPKDGPSAADPHKQAGLNIESLCASADGKTLFIGFRNPIPKGKALLVPLLNAEELVAKGGTHKARFGKPFDLDLGGLGFRDMVWWRDSYLIIGGDFGDRFEDDDSRPSRLFQWSGVADQKPVPVEFTPADGLDALNPEALIVFDEKRVLILSDDGAVKVDSKGNISNNGTKQKDALDKAKQFFRSVWLSATA